jgi:hypothetical protein
VLRSGRNHKFFGPKEALNDKASKKKKKKKKERKKEEEEERKKMQLLLASYADLLLFLQETLFLFDVFGCFVLFCFCRFIII